MNAILQHAHVYGQAQRAEAQTDLDRLLNREWTPREMLEGSSMDKMMAMAEHMANSRVSVPEHLRGNVGDCMAIVTQAMLWNMNPFAVAQKTHIVNGRLGYEAQLVNAVVQNSGAVRGAPRYEYDGDGQQLQCRVGYVLRGESEITWGEWLHIGQVTTKNSPLWKTNPKQQMGYLQLKNWARAFCPGAILGVYTTDELEDGSDFPAISTPTQTPRGPQRKSSAHPPASTNAGADPDTGEVAPPIPPAPPARTGQTTGVPAAASAESRGLIGVGQAAYLRGKLKAQGIDEAAICERYGVDKIEAMNVDAFDELKSELLGLG